MDSPSLTLPLSRRQWEAPTTVQSLSPCLAALCLVTGKLRGNFITNLQFYSISGFSILEGNAFFFLDCSPAKLGLNVSDLPTTSPNSVFFSLPQGLQWTLSSPTNPPRSSSLVIEVLLGPPLSASSSSSDSPIYSCEPMPSSI